MAHYVRLGDLPRKRHTQFRKPDGGLFAGIGNARVGYQAGTSRRFFSCGVRLRVKPGLRKMRLP